MTRLLVTTLPKSGTHFANLLMPGLGLQRHFCELGELTSGAISKDPELAERSAVGIADIASAMPDNSFILDHVPHSKRLSFELEQRGVHVVLMVRNVYDFVVSLAHHLHKDPARNTPTDLSLHGLQHWIATDNGPDENGEPVAPLAKRYLSRIGVWSTDQRAFLLRFEDVIGPRGGGLFSDQLATGLLLRDFLGVEMDNADVARALIKSFRPGISLFRRGQIGSWKDEMAPNTAEQIRLLYARFLEAWGYTAEGELVRRAHERPGMIEDMDRAVAGLIDDNVHLRAKVQRLIEESAEEAADPDETAGQAP